MNSQAMRTLQESLIKLPGVGNKTATRLAYHRRRKFSVGDKMKRQ